MRTNRQRVAWVLGIVVLLFVVGGGAFALGVAAGHGGFDGDLPMRGFGFRFPGVGLLGFLGPLVLIGLIIAFVGLLLGGSARSASPPAQHDVADGVDRLRELATMHSQGQLTDEEFTAAKRKLLGL